MTDTLTPLYQRTIDEEIKLRLLIADEIVRWNFKRDVAFEAVNRTIKLMGFTSVLELPSPTIIRPYRDGKPMKNAYSGIAVYPNEIWEAEGVTEVGAHCEAGAEHLGEVQ